MYSVELECEPEEKDLIIAELWEHGCAGITELTETSLRAFFAADSAEVRAALDPFGARWERVEERDWVAMAHARLEPMLVGQRFFLAPVWRDDPTPAGRMRIEVNPGMAFGTGAHETTQLCIEALERWVRRGAAVLDVGSGSGILSIAAQMLGAGRVVACDIDREAVEVSCRSVPSFVGSVDAVADHCADVLVVNIGPAAVIEMKPDIVRALRPAGVALVSGFEREDAAAVLEAYPGAALHAKNEWCLIEHMYLWGGQFCPQPPFQGGWTR
jgi:ribosomal protein L11 methyltransferase